MSTMLDQDGSMKEDRHENMPMTVQIEVDCPPEVQATTLITPASYQQPAIVGTATSDDATASVASEKENDDDSAIRRQLEEARWDAEQSAEALQNLVEGIRAVKRALEKSVGDEPDNEREAALTADIQRIHEIADALHGVLGSDLMSLVNAAGMIRDHSKLAAEEASVLIEDINKANEETDASATQAKIARQLSRKLYKKNLQLQSQVDRLRQERRALVKEVKSLREDAEETRKFDSWRLLEQHMLGSMAFHEMIMKTPTTPKPNAFKEDGEILEPTTFLGIETEIISSKPVKKVPKAIDTDLANDSIEMREQNAPSPVSWGQSLGGSGSIRGAFSGGLWNRTRFRPVRESPQSEVKALSNKETNTPARPQSARGKLESSPARPGSKSPIPSLAEASTFTDDSDGPTHAAQNNTVSTKMDLSKPNSLPTDVAFETSNRSSNRMGSWREFPSPLVSPKESPVGLATPDYKPICDPNILRTLAIPSNEKACIDYKRPSPRTRVAEGLHEC